MRSHAASVFGVPCARITPIQNGIDPGDLVPVAGDLRELRARYGKPDERLVLLVGRLVYEKGFHLALDALAPVIEKLGRVRFVVAGTGTAEAELRRQAWRLGLHRKGAFLGWVGDDMLHSLYRVAISASALGAILERVLTDEVQRRQLVAEAREHVLRFDWAEVARQTGDVYGELVRADRIRLARAP